ncbi:hypothetical protein [Rhizobiales bacterium]|uniref:hypothetical protein n=1 Tax=unclassified Ensifer TaxID=2633371 RepID=UPI0007241568|nr:hypothetical protein N183_16040 [Sinorhizobium sp. Sb3]
MFSTTNTRIVTFPSPSRTEIEHERGRCSRGAMIRPALCASATGLDFPVKLSDLRGIMMSTISSYHCFRVCPIAGT